MALALAFPLFAQDIHLQPRTVPDRPNAQAASPRSSELSLRMAPVRVNVNLVLVPVTVTDAMNRPILGLNKADFSLVDGEEQQDYKE